MAQVVNVEKHAPSKPKLSSKEKKSSKTPPLFRKENYIIMIIGIVIVAVGYILLSGGKAPSADVYSDAIFNTRRMVVAPTLILVGLITGIFAIMYHPKQKDVQKTEETAE
ncbi:DUF3098 domain-containing protein [Bacteroidales bacterium OttesenSCG-928-C03]|nr:DUF3098 domain-containing protein [Bacteroidales bacterium OttesenSCG-928-C03]MDL2326707.1 DUF3098 domain-containing protein [Bacteroidales bacterium OttesenSCG-928-A14]